jgi:hypothetical protein
MKKLKDYYFSLLIVEGYFWKEKYIFDKFKAKSTFLNSRAFEKDV